MKKCFVFCHGFGFDKDFWVGLAPYFANEKTIYLDLGYFGKPCNLSLDNNNIQLIGVGHSLGFLKLLSLNQTFDAVIGLNSFVNFTGFESNMHNKRKINLEKLKNYLITSSISTLKKFYEQCGASVDFKKLESINIEKMVEDLDFLLEPKSIPSTIPTLIIGAHNDIIVPPELMHDNFDNDLNVKLEIMQTGSHALGYLEPKAVYKKIICFLNDDR